VWLLYASAPARGAFETDLIMANSFQVVNIKKEQLSRRKDIDLR
jgi:hypothetical protein